MQMRGRHPNQVPNEVRIRRNLITNEQIPIVPLPDSKEGHFLLSTDSISALFASNPGSVDMEMTIIAVGD